MTPSADSDADRKEDPARTSSVATNSTGPGGLRPSPRKGPPTDKRLGNSLLGRTLSYGAVSLGTTVALFLLHIFAARLLTVADFGRFSFGLALAGLFTPFLDAGLYYLLIREIARQTERAKEYLSHALTWKLVSAPLVLALIVLTAHLVGTSPDARLAVYLLAVAQVLHSVKGALRPVLLGHERFMLDAASLTFERLALLGAGALVLLLGGGLVGLCTTVVAIRLVDVVFTGSLVHRLGLVLSFGTNFRFLRHMMGNAVRIGAFQITLVMYNYIDTVMIFWLRSSDEVGWYSAAFKLYEGLIILPVIIGSAFLPNISKQVAPDSRAALRSLTKEGLLYVLLTGFVIMSNGLLFGDQVIQILYGDQYHKSALALKLLLGGAVFAFTLNFLQTVMIAANLERAALVYAVGGLILNVTFNLLLIPRFGYLGAAVTTVVVEAIVLIVVASHLRRARVIGAQAAPWTRGALLPLAGLTIFLLFKDYAWLVQALAVNTVFMLVALWLLRHRIFGAPQP